MPSTRTPDKFEVKVYTDRGGRTYVEHPGALYPPTLDAARAVAERKLIGAEKGNEKEWAVHSQSEV